MKQKVTFVEIMVVIGIALMLATIIFDPFNRTKTPLEVEEPKAEIKHTDRSLTFEIKGDFSNGNVFPKMFFKLSDKRIINISMVYFNGIEWSYGNSQAITLQGAEKVRFEEWVDSWGVLTMEQNK